MFADNEPQQGSSYTLSSGDFVYVVADGDGNISDIGRKLGFDHIKVANDNMIGWSTVLSGGDELYINKDNMLSSPTEQQTGIFNRIGGFIKYISTPNSAFRRTTYKLS
jgi:hypothetical protein